MQSFLELNSLIVVNFRFVTEPSTVGRSTQSAYDSTPSSHPVAALVAKFESPSIIRVECTLGHTLYNYNLIFSFH